MRLAVAFKARALVGLRHRGSEELKNLCLFGELSWPLGSARNRATGGFLFIHTTRYVLCSSWPFFLSQLESSLFPALDLPALG